MLPCDSMSNLSLEAKQQQIKETILDSQRIASNTLDVGNNILNTLALQEETLNATEDTLEATEYLTEKSLRVLRGMTWSGMLYNMISSGKSEKPLDSNKGKSTSPIEVIEKNKQDINPFVDTIKDEDLAGLSFAIDQIKDMSITMAGEIQSQKETIERIQVKTDIVSDKTLAATLKATRLTRKSRGSKAVKVGRFQFVDFNSGRLLAANDEVLQLSDSMNRSTLFDVYFKDDEIVGLQNAKTLKFIGVTWTGSVAISGHHFGKSEECFIHISNGKPTGLLIVSKNWGSGGWIKYPSTINGPLNLTTASILDKKDILLLCPRKVEETVDIY